MAENKGLLKEKILNMKFDTTTLIDFGTHLTEHDVKQILAKIREVVEGAENPFDDCDCGCGEGDNQYGFEQGRQAILKAIKEGE